MEQLNEKPRAASLLSIHVVVSLVLFITTQIYFKGAIANYEGVDEVSFGPYKFFMLAICAFSFLNFLIFGYMIKKSNLFMWFAILYSFCGMFSTLLSGLYGFAELPFKFVIISYWVWIMVLSYYAVLHLQTFKFHIALVGIFLPIQFALFFMMTKASRGMGGTAGLLALNPVFYLYFLMPAVLLLRSKALKLSGVLLIFIAILLSYKRSAIVSFITAIPVYFYARSVTYTEAQLKKLMKYVIGGIFLLLVLIFSFKFITNVANLNWGARIEDVGSGSGRIDKYIGYMELMGDQSSQEWLFGHGYNSTSFTSLKWPHNDVLQILFEFGLLGFSFYLLFIVQMVRLFFEMKKYKYKHFDAYSVSLVMFFWGSMLSMLIVVPYWFLNLAFFWGWVIADFQNAKTYGDIEKIGNLLYVYGYEGSSEQDYQSIGTDGNEY